MSNAQIQQNRSVGWMGIHRGHKARPLEWIAEKLIFAISLSAILMVFLIFLFVAREAWPIFAETMNSAAIQPTIPASDTAKLSPEELRRYLDLTKAEFAAMDPDSIQALMEVREAAMNDLPAAVRSDKDAAVNTLSWRNLLQSRQWTGYDKPEYIWQPISSIHKYNIIPLIIGSIKASLVALAFSVPLALGAAIYVSQLARPSLKEWLKPAIEMLAGIPSVVVGSFAYIFLATSLQKLLGFESRLNALLAGIALGFAIIPVVFSIAEDALTSVPRAYTQAALALGASKWKAAWQIVLPAAIPGVFAAVVLGFGRAIGETMIVLLASGNASIVSWSVFDSTRTMTATIAAEMAEAVFGSHHYRILFMIGTLLFIVTFLSNLAGDLIIHRLKAKMEGKA